MEMKVLLVVWEHIIHREKKCKVNHALKHDLLRVIKKNAFIIDCMDDTATMGECARVMWALSIYLR